MKIIGYKTDHITATLKTVRGCELLCTVHGVEFYFSPVLKDERLTNYYYRINGTQNLLDRFNISSWLVPDEAKNFLLNTLTAEQIKNYAPDAPSILKRIKEAVEAKRWTSNGDALFCEIMGEFETAEIVRTNRSEYREKQRAERQEEEKQQEIKRLAEMQEKEQQRLKHIESVKQLILSESYITAAEFELIAQDCQITLPLKLIGWLRTYCGRIRIQKHTEQLPEGMRWLYKYETNYTYSKKRHTSQSIFKYADMIAEQLGL